METRLTGKHVLIILLGFFGSRRRRERASSSTWRSAPARARKKARATKRAFATTPRSPRQRAQNALQWRHQSAIAKRLAPARLHQERGRLARRRPCRSRAILAGRPTNSDDRTLAFKEVDAGVYEAELASVGAGKWVLAFSAEKARPGSDPAIYRVKERLWLNPEQSN